MRDERGAATHTIALLYASLLDRPPLSPRPAAMKHATNKPWGDALASQLNLQDGIRLAKMAGQCKDFSRAGSSVQILTPNTSRRGWEGTELLASVPRKCCKLTRLAHTMVTTFSPSRACWWWRDGKLCSRPHP